MAWYRDIDVGQEPFDAGLDGNGRLMFKFNILAVKRPSTTFIQEIVTRLATQGVGTFGTSLFASTQARVPDGDGPYLQVIETGGTAPDRTHNAAPAPGYQHPGAQITARAKTHAAARGMALAAYAALQIRNLELSDT